MSQINGWLKWGGFRFQLAVVLSAVVFGCTDKNTEAPFVLELRAIPNSIAINGQPFYPKPFSIRAKYSDHAEKNISARITWVSENLSLISVNKNGEIAKTGECLQDQCVVSLIATDPESGKSLRLTVNISPEKEQPDNDVEKTKLPERNDINNEVEQEDELPEVNIGVGNDEPTTANIVFSPMAEAYEIFDDGGAFSANSKESKIFIRKLVFEVNEALLISGEAYSPQIIAIDSFGQRHSDYEQFVVCYATNNFTLNVVVLPSCQLIAGKPGNAEIEVKLINGRQVDTKSLMVRVIPHPINSLSGGFSQNVIFSKDHAEQWFQVSGLQTSGYYRVLISGNLSLGYRLSVFNRPGAEYQACVNTVPTGANVVACYFQVLQSDVIFSVQNLGQQAAQFSLTLESAANDLFSNNAVLNSETPALLTLGNPITAFVFANKADHNNLHHYVFANDDELQRSLRVRLSGYSAQVKLNINWANGLCNESMFVFGRNDVVCFVPDYVNGKINISIDGNNGESGVLNGPAAEFGGTYYTLALDLIE